MIRKILALSFILAICLWMAGCQQVKHERHETITTETIESQEIVIE